MKKLDEMAAKVKALKEELKSQFEGAVKEAADEIFEKYPKLENFSWTQYTPHFNDGEPCEFSIHNDCDYTYNGVEINSSATSYKGGLNKEGKEAGFESEKEANDLEEVLSDFVSKLEEMEETVRACLDEGRVIVSREGVEVEDYDHD